MAKEGMITKGVTFNENDPDQLKMLNYATSYPNYSAYIKRLIHKDMINNKVVPNKDFELDNFIKMLSFLTIKQWEAKEDGYALVKEEELKIIEEFISAFSDLTHNTSMWRERFNDEGYTSLVKVIEEARRFL